MSELWYCTHMFPTSTLRLRDELRQAILEGALEPGQRLRAEHLAERFSTSRTPVREALVLLEGEGLVDLEPRRGALVRPFDIADVLDLYEVRALLEPHAAARAATRVSPEALERLRELCTAAERPGADHLALNESFHAEILVAASSARLESALRGVAGIPRAFRSAYWASADMRARSLAAHRDLVSALAAGEAELAAATMRAHVLGARAFLLEVGGG